MSPVDRPPNLEFEPSTRGSTLTTVLLIHRQVRPSRLASVRSFSTFRLNVGLTRGLIRFPRRFLLNRQTTIVSVPLLSHDAIIAYRWLLRRESTRTEPVILSNEFAGATFTDITMHQSIWCPSVFQHPLLVTTELVMSSRHACAIYHSENILNRDTVHSKIRRHATVRQLVCCVSVFPHPLLLVIYSRHACAIHHSGNILNRDTQYNIHTVPAR